MFVDENLEELLAVPTEEVVRAQREISIVTAAIADLTYEPGWPQLIATRCDEPFVPEWALENLVPKDAMGLSYPRLLVLKNGGTGHFPEAWNAWLDGWKYRDHSGVIIANSPSTNSATDARTAYEIAELIHAERILFVFAAWSAARGALAALQQYEGYVGRLDFAIAQRPLRGEYPISWPNIERLFDIEARKLVAYQTKGDVASLSDFSSWIATRRMR